MSKLLPILLDQFTPSRRRLLRGGAALTILKSGEPITIVAIGSSYGCFAKGLGTAIAEAAQRPVVSAKAMPHLVR